MKGMIELACFTTKSLHTMAKELMRGDLGNAQRLALEQVIDELARRAE